MTDDSGITTWSELEASLDELIDDCYPAIEIIGMTYMPSEVLRSIDLIAYREVLLDHANTLDIDADELSGWPRN
jgi:hypothetical protein